MESHWGHVHMSKDVGGVKGKVGRGPLESKWFCHPPGQAGGHLRASASVQAAFSHNWLCVWQGLTGALGFLPVQLPELLLWALGPQRDLDQLPLQLEQPQAQDAFG